MKNRWIISALILSTAPVNATFDRYRKGDAVPSEIVDLAHCSDPGKWTFAADVRVWKDGNIWYVRPSDDPNAQTAEYLININGAKYCNILSEWLNVQNGPDDEVNTLYKGPK